MTERKTNQNDGSVQAWLSSIDDPIKAADAAAVATLMSEVSGAEAAMWGTAIVGFGRYERTYDSGRDGSFFLCGFAARKSGLVVYVMPGFDAYDDLLARLGRHKTGKSCLYIKRLSDVDVGVLRELVAQSVALMRSRYPCTP